MIPAATVCSQHVQRHALAICMSCRSAICQECATQWDGIWQCQRCLGRTRAASTKRNRVTLWIALIVMIALLLIVSEQLSVWSAVMAARLLD